MKQNYSFHCLLLFLYLAVAGTGQAGTPTCNPPSGMGSEAARSSFPNQPRAARMAASADLSYANINKSAQIRLKNSSSGLVADGLITINEDDYARFASSGNQLINQRSLDPEAMITMTIGRADSQQAQHWVIPDQFSGITLSELKADFISNNDVPAELRYAVATHVLKYNLNDTLLYTAYQLKSDEVELLGYGLDLPAGNGYKVDNSDLLASRYSNVPLKLGDEFLYVRHQWSVDRNDRIELHSGVRYDAFGTLTTPAGTFNALRFTTQDTTRYYSGASSKPYNDSRSERVGWVTNEGIYFDGEIRNYNSTTDEASLALLNYQTVSAPLSQSFALGQPTYDCTTGSFRFNTVGGDASPIEYYAVPGITNWTTNPNQFVDTEMRTAADAPTITLKARQNGVEVSLPWAIRDVCPLGGPNQPAPNQSPSLRTPIPDQTTALDQSFSYVLPATTFGDPNGDALTYTLSGLPAGLSFAGTTLSGTPTQSGNFTLTVTATDPGGLTTSDMFVLTVAPAPTTDFAIVGVSPGGCIVGAGGERQVTFTPQYKGRNGQTLTFQVANEMLPVTTPGPYTLRLYVDNPVITLRAQQENSGNAVTFAYAWLSGCGSVSGRESADISSESPIRLLGNPVNNKTAEVELNGVTGQRVQLRLLDSRGRVVDQQTVPEARPAERVRFLLPGGTGLFLLDVTTPTHRQQLKVISQ